MTARALAFLISMVLLIGLVFGMVAVTGAEPKPTVDDPWAGVPVWPKPTDHAAFFPRFLHRRLLRREARLDVTLGRHPSLAVARANEAYAKLVSDLTLQGVRGI